MSSALLKPVALLCLGTTSFLVQNVHAATDPAQTTTQESSTVTSSGLIPMQAANNDKHWNVGVSSYSLGIYTEDNSYFADDYDYDDEFFVGGAFFVNYHFNESISARVQFYAIEHDDFSEIEMSGVDLLLYWGGGFLSEGFKWYIGGGAYSETLEIGNYEEDFSGGQLNGGIGYNWEHIALDFSIGARTTSDYEDFADDEETTIDRDEDMFALTAALGVSVRF